MDAWVYLNDVDAAAFPRWRLFADTDAPRAGSGSTSCSALHTAIWMGDADVVSRCLSRPDRGNRKVSGIASDSIGLHFIEAADEGNEAGPAPRPDVSGMCPTPTGFNALHLCAMYNETEIMALLLAHLEKRRAVHRFINMRAGPLAKTPLMVAAQCIPSLPHTSAETMQQTPHCVRLLLAAKADANASDAVGRHALDILRASVVHCRDKRPDEYELRLIASLLIQPLQSATSNLSGKKAKRCDQKVTPPSMHHPP